MSEPNRLVERIRAEYRSIPGFKITCLQAARLWNAPEAECLAAFELLVAERFLWRAPSGRYVALSSADSSASVPARLTFRCPHCRKQNAVDRDQPISAREMALSVRCVACRRVFSLSDAAA
jgi:predicted Zn finger-like uncharacterized protein